MSLVTLSSLTLAGIRLEASSRWEVEFSAAEEAYLLRDTGECICDGVVVGLFRLLVENLLTNDVLCLNL